MEGAGRLGRQSSDGNSAWGPITAGKLGIEPAEVPLAMGTQSGAGRGTTPRRTHEARLGHRNLGGRGWREDKSDKKVAEQVGL